MFGWSSSKPRFTIIIRALVHHHPGQLFVSAPTISRGSCQNSRLHTGARVNVVLLTYLLWFTIIKVLVQRPGPSSVLWKVSVRHNGQSAGLWQSMLPIQILDLCEMYQISSSYDLSGFFEVLCFHIGLKNSPKPGSGPNCLAFDWPLHSTVKDFASLCSYSTRGCMCGSGQISIEMVRRTTVKGLLSNEGVGYKCLAYRIEWHTNNNNNNNNNLDWWHCHRDAPYKM